MKLESPWTPRIASSIGPLHERLANAISDDILAGRIPAGARLPTHRQVAAHLDLSIGTVTRAYAHLQRLGLVKSEVGRGMFVGLGGRRAAQPVDLSHNIPPPVVSGDRFMDVLAKVRSDAGADFFTRYTCAAGQPEHRALLARTVLQGRGVVADPNRVVLTTGAQQAIFLALAATRAGTLAVEALTYPGTLRCAKQLSRSLVPIAIDDEGIVPEALEAALQGPNPPTVLYLVPTIQNPTGAVMSVVRRRAIAELAQRSGLIVIEDDVHAIFASGDLPAIARFAPDNVFYVGSLSKCLAPGLRTGYVVAPERFLESINDWLLATQTMSNPLSGLLMAHWLSTDLMTTTEVAMREQARRRNDLARSILGPWLAPMAHDALHVWLPMETTRARAVVLTASQSGLTLAPPEAFMVDPAQAKSGLRICLGGLTELELSEALRSLAQVLASVGKSRFDLAGII